MGYPASAMGPQLRAYVEHQLLTDLQFYGVPTVGLSFDWSNPCQEGHVTRYLDGMLEEMSDVGVNRSDGTPVAEGWLDFIHWWRRRPTLCFWLFLRLDTAGKSGLRPGFVMSSIFRWHGRRI